MIKCIECGFETDRLQWTHFKFGCTGRFQNSKEYRNVYPDSKLVSETLAKKTAVTEKNLINKYGETEGKKKWLQYKEKQAKSNTLEYKQEKYGWTEEDFNEYNITRSSTLENFVRRHGEDGVWLWNEYCERQRYTTTKEYFIEKYGDRGFEKWKIYCNERSKSSNIDYISEKYNVSKEEAQEILSERLSGNFVSQGEKDFIGYIENVIQDIDYTYKNKQYCIWNNQNSSPMFYDITSSKRKKIIEYNGDYWHANPLLYEDSFVVKQNGMTAKEIRERDRIKTAAAKERGFDIFIVWENDFIKNPEKVLENIRGWWDEK